MFRTILIIVMFLTGGPIVAAAHPAAATDAAPGEAPVTQTELQLGLRDLWSGHVFWVRSVVIASHYEDDNGAAAAEAKTVENARNIAGAITPFYGQEASDQLFELLAGHYGAIKNYMRAGFDEDEEGQRAASSELAVNAEALSTFLDGANPYLPKDAVLPLLMAHGGHHMQQIGAVHEGDFEEEAVVWDAMLGHVYTIADAMADAFARQFPEKVTG